MDQIEEVKRQVIQFFSEKLQIDVPTVETDLIDEGLLDSLVFVDLIMHLEQMAGREISIADLELDQFRSVDRIATFLLGHREPAGDSASTASVPLDPQNKVATTL